MPNEAPFRSSLQKNIDPVRTIGPVRCLREQLYKRPLSLTFSLGPVTPAAYSRIDMPSEGIVSHMPLQLYP